MNPITVIGTLALLSAFSYGQLTDIIMDSKEMRESVGWNLWVSQITDADDIATAYRKPFHVGTSIKVDIRDPKFAREVHLHFRSKSRNPVHILAIRLNREKCTQRILNIAESDFSFDSSWVITNFKITPSMEWEGIVFVSSNTSTEFWGWIPLHFVPCVKDDTGKCPNGSINAQAYVTVKFLDAQGQRRLKQEIRGNCSATLDEIHELLHNPVKGVNPDASQSPKIYYKADHGAIHLCTDSSEEIVIVTNTHSSEDYSNQIRQLYKIEPHRYIRVSDVSNYNNCAEVYYFTTLGDSFSYTLETNGEPTEVGIVRQKFKSDDESTRFFYSDDANKADYATVGNFTQKQTSINQTLVDGPVFYDAWQYSSSPHFSNESITCNVSELTLQDVSYKKADTLSRHATQLALKFHGILPKGTITGECEIQLRHRDNSTIRKIAKFVLEPPPQLHLQNSFVEDGQTVLRISDNISEIRGKISAGNPNATLYLNCSKENLLKTTNASNNGSFIFTLDPNPDRLCEEWTLHAEGISGQSDIVIVKIVPKIQTDGESFNWIVWSFGILVVIAILGALIITFRNWLIRRNDPPPVEYHNNALD